MFGELEESINNLAAENVAAGLATHGWEFRAKAMERHMTRLVDEM